MKKDHIGIGLTIVACILILCIIGKCRTYAPIKQEGFIAGVPGPGLATPPDSIKCKIMSLNIDPTAVSFSQSGGKTWLCKSTKDAATLIKGAKVSIGYVPYIARNDSVCVDQEGDEKFYTCLDLTLDINSDDTPTIIYTNHETSCKNYEKKFYDLSGALTTLMAMKRSINSNSIQLTESYTTLDTMYSAYSCDTVSEPSKKVICNAITQARYLIDQNKNKAVNLENILMPAIQPALDSRAKLIQTIQEYKCKFKLPST